MSEHLFNVRWAASGAFAMAAFILMLSHLFPSMRGPTYKEPEELIVGVIFAVLAVWLRP